MLPFRCDFRNFSTATEKSKKYTSAQRPHCANQSPYSQGSVELFCLKMCDASPTL